MYRADYTPWHGEFFKWRRDYLNDTERSISTVPGRNPFEKFKGAGNTDHVFHNISWEGASVAVGLAMIHAKAHMGWVMSSTSRFTTSTKKSGGMFRKRITTYVDAYSKPQWFVATPIEWQPKGGIASICTVDVGTKTATGATQSCDDPAHLASSFVSMEEWKGGNMPNIEEHMYSYVYSKSSLTMLAFTIITFFVSYGILSGLNMAVAGAGSVSFAGGAVGVSALQGAAIGAGIYAGVNLLSGSGLTSAQAGWAGNTGNGVLMPDTTNMSEHQARLNQALHNKQIVSKVGTGMQSNRALYLGTCPQNYTLEQCQAAGLDQGQTLRPDHYVEENLVLELRKRELKCKQDLFPKYANNEQNIQIPPEIRKQIQKCTSMDKDVWTLETGQ